MLCSRRLVLKEAGMGETDETLIFSQETVEAFASAWASIDGKLDAFNRERGAGVSRDDPTYTGHYEGYMAEAQELLFRAHERMLPKFNLWYYLP
jgi:hypothetical protein